VKEEDILNFYDVNSKNILLEPISNNDFLYPEVSIILLMYNQANIIHIALRSIQNQSLKNIEIIIIDDCSTDNSIQIIKEFQKEDKRIRLIENEYNEGKIKSRSKGIRICKGKYITIIDGDDALIHKDILYNSYNIGKIGNLDIVELLIAKYKRKKYLGLLANYDLIKGLEDKIIYQPDLRTKFIIRNEEPKVRGIINRNICGKLIKNELFQKALSKIGLKYTEDYILVYEDTIMAITLLQIAKSYYLMKTKGYYYNKAKKNDYFNYNQYKNRKKCRQNNNIIKGIDQAKYLNFLIEHTKDNYIERQLIYYEIKSMSYWEGFAKTIENHFYLLYEVFDKILKMRFLKRKQIKKIMFIINKLKEKEMKNNKN